MRFAKLFAVGVTTELASLALDNRPEFSISEVECHRWIAEQ